MQLKHIDFNQKSFEANGKEYFVESELSIERSVWREHFTLMLERGISVGKQTDDWQKVYDLANEQKFADIVVVAYNNRTGFKTLFENRPTVLKLCALFINTKDEDRRTINDIMINEKISDWHEEGYAMSSFFLLAISFLQIEVASYQKATKDILDTMERFRSDINALAGMPISN